MPARSTVRIALLDVLEPRLLMSGSPSFVYVETNNPLHNAVIAYRRNPTDGDLSQIGSFDTGGTGFLNSKNLLGPDDSDAEVIASQDGRLLFAVNQGSNSISAFEVRPDGGLALVNNAAVASGGIQPVSLSISGDKLYVLNRGNEIQGETGTIPPTIAVFQIGASGSLTQLKDATITLTAGLSPSQVLAARNASLLFADTFTPPPLLNVPQANAILPFVIGPDGKLTAASSGAVGAGVSPPLLLGLAEHPTQSILYAGLTGASQLGVFTFDAAGKVTPVTTVPVQGRGPCWCTISPDGRFLYTTDTGTDSVGVFSLADPLHPVQVQEFTLGGPHNAANDPAQPNQLGAFEFAFDPSGNSLYVLTHQTAPPGTFPAGNALHVLTVAADGTLSERADSPLFFGNLPAGTHPQGVAVINVDRRVLAQALHHDEETVAAALSRVAVAVEPAAAPRIADSVFHGRVNVAVAESRLPSGVGRIQQINPDALLAP